MSDTYIVDRGLVHNGKSIHGVNPSLLIEKIIRERIQETVYWKQHCFGLNCATLCDRVVEDVLFIGGEYGGNLRVAPFLCLVFKLVLLQPEDEIIEYYLQQPDFKYLRAIAAMYIRLFYKPERVYTLLEPFLNDYRKLRIRDNSGVGLTYMDVFIDDLLTKERVLSIALPRMISRQVLEDQDKLEPRESAIADEINSDSESASE